MYMFGKARFGKAKFGKARGGRSVALLAAVTVLMAMTGCSTTAGSNTGIAAATGSQPVAGRPQPLANPNKKSITIDVLGGPGGLAEFFKAVTAGSLRAGEVLKGRGVKVTYIPLTDFTADGVNNALRTVITQKPDAILTQLLGPANCQPIKEAVQAGIKVGTMISGADCLESTGAMFFHGENTGPAWSKLITDTLAKATGDKACKVGIITGWFDVPAIEARRQAIVAGLAETKMTPVSKGVAVAEDTSKMQAAARDYANSNPDLCALVTDVSDNGATAAALSPEQQKKIKVISADLTDGIIKQIKAGTQFASYTQDPFGETYDSVMWLYNSVISGKNQVTGFLQATKNLVVTKDNLAQAVKVQSEGQ
jgi:ribose transport system substrate-binding protein